MRIPHILASVCLTAALLACGGDSGTAPSQSSAPAPAGEDVKADVEAAVRKHLSKRSDLDMSAMNLTIQNVDVQGDTAVATVAFEVKDHPGAGMSMSYNLAKENGEWVVQAKPAGHGTTPQTAPGQSLPPGHPPAEGTKPAQELPQNHPPVAQ